MRNKGWLWAGSFVALSAVAALGVAVGATLAFNGRDEICRGVSIEGIPVGGLTRKQCAETMQSWAVKESTRRVILTALDERWMGAMPDFGARFEWQKAVEEAYAVGRAGTFLKRAVCVLTDGGAAKEVQVAVAVDRSKIARTIKKVAAKVNRPHRDARLVQTDGRLSTTQDSKGIKLNEAEALSVIENALTSGKSVAALPVEEDLPDVTSADAARIDTLLARFTTRFNPAKRDRSHNLLLAAKEINGIVIKPGMEFSYNSTVGPRVVERGFREAPIFVNGRMEPGLGGGICQVSTTLYNAVLMTGLKVVERHHHSRTVPYVTAGRDATVAFGLQDFRFSNPFQSPVAVLTQMGKSSLTVDIYGSAQDKKEISIFSGPAEYTPNSTKTVVDASVPDGIRKVLDSGSRGVRVTVYRKIKMPDGTHVTETVSKDRYRPQPTIVGVSKTESLAATGGTGPAETTLTSTSGEPVSQTDTL